MSKETGFFEALARRWNETRTRRRAARVREIDAELRGIDAELDEMSPVAHLGRHHLFERDSSLRTERARLTGETVSSAPPRAA